MSFGFNHYAFCFVVFLLYLFALYSPADGKEAYYDSSYAFLAAQNSKTLKQRRFCVNYEQWRTSKIASSLAEAEIFRLAWWGDFVNNTNVCNKNASSTYRGDVVALNYRLEKSDGACAAPYVATNTSFKGAIQFEVNELLASKAGAGLLLVEKGRKFVSRWSDYLFSEFYDPDLNQSTPLPVFFMYKHVFFNDLVGQINDGSTELYLRFYRPKSSPWDLSMLIIWLLAVLCVGAGGYWAGHRKTCEERSENEQQLARSVILSESQRKKLESDEEKLTTPANCLFVLIVMIIVVGILMLGFYFRNVMVYVFNVILAVVGTFSMHRCLSAVMSNFCKCGQCHVCVSMNDVTRSIFRRDLFNYDCCSRRPRVASILLFILSAAICIFWFFYRRNPYAFILLDLINVTLCLHVLKGIRFPNLKWLTVLLLCMFVYDMFMVFGTPYLTKNGCSVMIEVAAGTDCVKSSSGYPVAPISGDIPEKFPMLFQVPRLSDPMLSCIDLEIEKEFHPVILGLGDIIVPGYLISFCFTVDFSARTRHLYGLVSVAGYGVGLIATFFALTAMEMAQPALIYLIPFTLIPIVILALMRKEFKLLWNGNFSKPEERLVEQLEEGSESSRNPSTSETVTSSVLSSRNEAQDFARIR